MIKDFIPLILLLLLVFWIFWRGYKNLQNLEKQDILQREINEILDERKLNNIPKQNEM